MHNKHNTSLYCVESVFHDVYSLLQSYTYKQYTSQQILQTKHHPI